MPHEPLAALHPWGCSGEFMGQFYFHALQTSASLLKAQKKDPISASCINWGWFFGVEPGDWTEVQQILSHSGGETWQGVHEWKGLESSVSWISILECPGMGSVLSTLVPLNPKPEGVPTPIISGQSCSCICSPAPHHEIITCHSNWPEKLKVPFKTCCLLDENISH